MSSNTQYSLWQDTLLANLTPHNHVVLNGETKLLEGGSILSYWGGFDDGRPPSLSSCQAIKFVGRQMVRSCCNRMATGLAGRCQWLKAYAATESLLSTNMPALRYSDWQDKHSCSFCQGSLPIIPSGDLGVLSGHCFTPCEVQTRSAVATVVRGVLNIWRRRA